MTQTMREWEQAWAHSRHLESMRGQYLGFFFTAMLGVTAIAGPRLAHDSFRAPGSLLLVAALALGLELLSGFLYLAVARINAVLAYYLRVVIAIREGVGSREGAIDLSAHLYPPKPRYRWAGNSGASEYVLLLGLFVFPLVMVATVARSIHLTGISKTTVVCTAMLFVALGAAVLVVVGGKKPREAEKAEGEL